MRLYPRTRGAVVERLIQVSDERIQVTKRGVANRQAVAAQGSVSSRQNLAYRLTVKRVSGVMVDQTAEAATEFDVDIQRCSLFCQRSTASGGSIHGISG